MKIRYYITADGKAPFTKWLDRVRDKTARAAILKRIARIQLGLFGDAKSVGSGVHELRVDVGAGYRVYTLVREMRLCFFYAEAIKAHKPTTSRRQNTTGKIIKRRTDETGSKKTNSTCG